MGDDIYSDYLQQRYGVDFNNNDVFEDRKTTMTNNSRQMQQQSSAPSYSSSTNSDDQSLMPVEEIEERFRFMFPYQNFNNVQSRIFRATYQSDENVVVSGPTASGKTVVFELALLRLFFPDPLQTQKADVKSIYIAPLKSLCQERVQDWSEKFGKLGVYCACVTGDQETPFQDILKADIIISTPEKWDSLTRRFSDQPGLFKSCGLMCIDECHILQEDRGATLEGLVSRYKMLFSKFKNDSPAQLRFIALSATVSNYEDVAQWLKATPFFFGEEYRPVPLEFHVLGFKQAKNDYLFDHHLNFKLLEIIRKYSSGAPALVFCSSRKGCINAANQIIKDASNGSRNVLIRDSDHRTRLMQAASKVTNKSLAECLIQGVGFHSAALSFEDRATVEKLFLDSDLSALCTTTTLAQGVNLPAHLVIVKSTKYWKKGKGWIDYSKSSVLQMTGRAGRPQYDTTGVAVVLTNMECVREYENLVAGLIPVESNLHMHCIEHINAEINARTMVPPPLKMQFVGLNRPFCMMKKNPKAYDVPANVSAEKFDEIIKDKMLFEIGRLANEKMIEYSKDKATFRSTLKGSLIARHYLQFETSKLFDRLDPRTDMEHFLLALSECSEFSDLQIRQGEKTVLNKLCKKGTKIRFPLHGNVKTTAEKVSILIQATLDSKPISEWNLKQDVEACFSTATRVCRAVIDYFSGTKQHFEVLYIALLFQKCLEERMWETSTEYLRQVTGIGVVLLAKLNSANVTRFDHLNSLTSTQIEKICERKPPFGSKIKEAMRAIPKYTMNTTVTNGELTGRVEQTNESFIPSSRHGAYILVGNEANALLFCKRLGFNEETSMFEFNVRVQPSQVVKCHVVDQLYFGVDVSQSFSIAHSRFSSESVQPSVSYASSSSSSSSSNSKSSLFSSSSSSSLASSTSRHSMPYSTSSATSSLFPSSKRQSVKPNKQLSISDSLQRAANATATAKNASSSASTTTSSSSSSYFHNRFPHLNSSALPSVTNTAKTEATDSKEAATSTPPTSTMSLFTFQRSPRPQPSNRFFAAKSTSSLSSKPDTDLDNTGFTSTSTESQTSTDAYTNEQDQSDYKTTPLSDRFALAFAKVNSHQAKRKAPSPGPSPTDERQPTSMLSLSNSSSGPSSSNVDRDHIPAKRLQISSFYDNDSLNDESTDIDTGPPSSIEVDNSNHNAYITAMTKPVDSELVQSEDSDFGGTQPKNKQWPSSRSSASSVTFKPSLTNLTAALIRRTSSGLRRQFEKSSEAKKGNTSGSKQRPRLDFRDKLFSANASRGKSKTQINLEYLRERRKQLGLSNAWKRPSSNSDATARVSNNEFTNAFSFPSSSTDYKHEDLSSSDVNSFPFETISASNESMATVSSPQDQQYTDMYHDQSQQQMQEIDVMPTPTKTSPHALAFDRSLSNSASLTCDLSTPRSRASVPPVVDYSQIFRDLF